MCKIVNHFQANLDLGWEDCQHTVIDEILCLVTGFALRTDVQCMSLDVSKEVSQHG